MKTLLSYIILPVFSIIFITGCAPSRQVVNNNNGAYNNYYSPYYSGFNFGWGGPYYYNGYGRGNYYGNGRNGYTRSGSARGGFGSIGGGHGGGHGS